MKSLQESPALLSVHSGSDGQYILRLGDLKYRPLLISVSKLLPGARQLVIVTPSDIKVMEVSDDAAPAPRSEDTDDPSVVLDAETMEAIALADQDAPPQSDVVGETPQGTKVVRRKARSKSDQAGHDEACGRCRGAGRVAIMLEGGQPSDTACPICKGDGTIRRYGSRR